MSHVRIAPTQAMLNATRVAAGEANLVLGCDVLTTTAIARQDGRGRRKP
jgi:indolepyruvate ferredoxin oxidoreductase